MDFQVWLSSRLVSAQEALVAAAESGDPVWRHRVVSLIRMALDTLARPPPSDNNKENLNPLLRVLEILTGVGSDAARAILGRLFSLGYFSSLRSLCDRRVPPLLEETVRPPVPLAGLILNMLLRPLKLLTGDTTAEYRRSMRKGLCEAFFAREFSQQVCDFKIRVV